MLNRTCLNDYKIPGTDKIIEKGVQIIIPAMALHNDEAYYKEPNKFDPDRFNEENSEGKNIGNRPFFPFGEGQRNCIGNTNVLLSTKCTFSQTTKTFF